MAFDQSTRNRLQRFVSTSRTLLTDEFTKQLQSKYGMDPNTGTIAKMDTLHSLSNEERVTAIVLRETVQHYIVSTSGKTEKEKTKQVLDRVIREQAFTILNRLCAIKMSEAREFILESISKGFQSKGFQLYKNLAGTALGETGDTYNQFLFSLFDELSLDLAVLFDRYNIQGRLFPRETALLLLLAEINKDDIEHLWVEDETIGWIYQYFNSQEERKKMRDESQAPRNSRELAVRNQFFTPRYVVEFLTDNTLGRIWYEMCKGKTGLVDQCKYLVRRPTEIFLELREVAPTEKVVISSETTEESKTQEELLQEPVYITHRPLKDPRILRMLDPACGSMHFGLYSFDLFEKIYEEAWNLENELGKDVFEREAGFTPLTETYSNFEEFQKLIPKLIIEHNIHGVDIDSRAVQIAGLSLWLRAQKSWQRLGVKPLLRPTIRKSNVVCAEPMPGDQEILKEFTKNLNPPVLGSLVEVIFEKMKLAGEAGTLLKIEEEIQTAIENAKQKLKEEISIQKSDASYLPKFAPMRNFEVLHHSSTSDFWETVEERILETLREYADQEESLNAQKRMFAEDAARGFAFIDLCRKRFDVVLMNPPFGDISLLAEKYFLTNYLNYCQNIISPFISRATILLLSSGMSGAIFDKTISIKSSYLKIRKEYLFGENTLIISSDLGWGVLDQAQVETVINIFTKKRDNKYIYNLLIDEGTSSYIIKSVFPLSSIEKIPNLALSLELPQNILKVFQKYKSLEPDYAVARQGLGISDSWRWYRTKAEIPLGKIGKENDYVWLANGGGFSPFFRDSDLTIYWKNDGELIKAVESAIYGNYTRTVKNIEYYFLDGISFPKRTDILNAHFLPSGHIFTVEGLGCFPIRNNNLWHIISLLNSKLLGYLINTFCGQHKHVGYIKQLPYSNVNTNELSGLSKKAFFIKKKISKYFCNTSIFCGPLIILFKDFTSDLNLEYITTSSIIQRIDIIVTEIKNLNFMLEEIQVAIDELVYNSYELDRDTIKYIEENIGNKTYLILDGISKVEDIKKLLLSDLLDYLIGYTFGHYLSIETIKCNWESDDQILPNVAPIIKINNEKTVIIELSNNGISMNFINEFKKIFTIYNLEIEEFEKAIDINYGTGSLIEILVDTSKFFDMHLLTYSKSRRPTPIYWPLQTPSCSYTLWIYYHRLTDQTLYTCVNDFVEPKLKSTEAELISLREKTNRTSAEEREYSQLSELERELKDYRDELLRIAKFWKPNLNDGVQITAAPLWKLFQHRAWQKKLKETWDQLEAGDFDWAHLALSIWPDRVLQKCHTDRSFAIAHEVENDFWEEVDEPQKRGASKKVWKPKKLSSDQVNEIIKKRKESI